jgi:hypothetical protein
MEKEQLETKETESKIAYTEEEAAEVLKMPSVRSLADFRRKYLQIGKHYGRVGRKVRYTPRQIQNIVEMDNKVA